MSDPVTGDGSAPQDSILIVSDDPAEMRRLRRALEPMGRQVLEAGTHRTTSGRALDEGIAVVVLDARMNATGGVATVRTIRSRQGADSLPVVLVTENAAAEATVEVYALGAIDIVSTPVLPEALRARVTTLAELSTKTRVLRLLADRLLHADELAARQGAALKAQQAVVRALARGDADDVVMPRLARRIALDLGWEVCAYWATAGAEAQCVGLWCDPSVAASVSERLQAAAEWGPGEGVVRRASLSGSPEWNLLTGGEHRDAYARAAYGAGLAGALALPVTLSSGRPGVIELMRRAPDPPHPQVLTSLTAVLALIGRVLDARRSHDEAERLKNEFFALVSHELLTPLTSILGYLEELLGPGASGLTGEQSENLEVVDRNARRLHRLVNDLIFVAQVEAGRLSLELASVDLAAIADEAVDAARSAARRRDIDIGLHVVPVRAVHGDPKRLGQVVDNLISNAVKFSHEGGRVDVVLEPDGGDAVIEVIDRGIGIPVDERERVFERYFRSSTGMAKEAPGIGLGLSICKAIVEAHGGSIALGAADGEGSTFRVTLPFEAGTVQGGLHHDQGAKR
jgi:signal transduction histidine kinase